MLEVTFAAVSSEGVRARAGRSAAWAGRNGVPAIDETVMIAYTIHAGPPTAIVPAMTPISEARVMSAPTITSRRGKRSASVAVNGAASAAGIIWSTPTRATAPAPPWA